MIITTRAVITDIEHSPDGVVAMVTMQPDESFLFCAGQFCMIQKVIRGHVVRKPYSIASTSSANVGCIQFLIKRASSHGMSAYLTQDATCGDEVTLCGPAGHMVAIHESCTYLLISTGSGLGPVYSIYHDLLYTNTYKQIIQLYGEQTKNMIVPSVRDVLTSETDKRISNIITLSREKHQQCAYGRVQALLDRIFGMIDDVSNVRVYVCGKPVMVDDVIQRLVNDFHVSTSSIQSEAY